MTVRDHVLKCWPGPYWALVDGKKPFEWRRDDRGYEEGHRLVLLEWDPTTQKYTGEGLIVVVTYILRGRFGVPDGYCVMGFDTSKAHLRTTPAEWGIARGAVRK